MEQEAQTTEAEQDQQAPGAGQHKPPPVPLPGPAHWLGAEDGYASSDLVSLQVAYERSEVARPDPKVRHNEVLELRIHGVGGASAEANLETPTTLMVSGDKKAGFYRAWFPGQGRAQTPLREAYCWGRFSYAAITSAVWLLLLPFALVNLACWALPSPHREGKPAPERAMWRGRRRLSRVVLRLLGLVFTCAFTITVCYLLVVIVARQAADDGALPKWLGWYENWDSGVRQAIALAIVLAIIVGLRIFSGFTTGLYEEWSPGGELPKQDKMRLSSPDMWRGSDSVRRQQFCHVLAAGAIILTFATLALEAGSALKPVGAVVAGAMVGFAALVLVAPGCDRLWLTQEQTDTEHPSGRSWALHPGVQKFLAGVVWVGLVAAIVFVGFAGSSVKSTTFGVENFLLHAPVLAEFGLLVALSFVLWLQRPWQQADVFAFGFLSVLVSGLAVGVSSIFGGALLLTATNVLSTPSLDETTGKKSISLPGVVTAGSLAFLATLVAVLCVIVTVFVCRWLIKRRLSKDEASGGRSLGRGVVDGWKPRNLPVVTEYAAEGLPVGGGYGKATEKVAGIWAWSSMTDYAARVGAGVAAPTLLVLAVAEVYGFADPTNLDPFLDLAQWGSTATVAATVAFIGFLRAALVSEAQRRKFAFFWDVVNFWPRAAHPFAPPCYAERVVPEVTTRIRRFVGDHVRGDKDPADGQKTSEGGSSPDDSVFEPHRPVVLNGYSQGSPISVAVMAQLPEDTHERVALLTLACPAHRLYGRAFPLYFGPDQLEEMLTGRLGGHGPDTRRWINMCRRSDYVGGPVGIPGVDEWILDPPALWPDWNPTRVPAHLHSDWFPDPQTHPNVKVLAKLLPHLPDLDDVDAVVDAARALPGFAGAELRLSVGELVIWSTHTPPAELTGPAVAGLEGLVVSWHRVTRPQS